MEGYWTLRHAKGTTRVSRPPTTSYVQIEDDSDRSDEDSSEETGSVRSLLLEGSTDSQLQTFAKRSFEEVPILIHEQEQSTLFNLPADAMLLILQHLTDIPLVQSLSVCRSWRSLLLQEVPANSIFWRNEVRNLTQTAKVWRDHPGLYKTYFGDMIPPEVQDSFLLCRLRLKKKHDIIQRRKLLQSILPRDLESCKPDTKPFKYNFPLAKAFIKLSSVLHRRGILEVLYLAFFYMQGAVLLTTLSVANTDLGVNILLCFIPTYIMTIFVLVVAIADVVALVFGGELNKLLCQRRWISISEHCTTNRISILVCVVLWCCFVATIQFKIIAETTKLLSKYHFGWLIAVSPLILLIVYVVGVHVADLYRQKDLYFWLDNGYDFIETSLVQEAQLQQSETWNHLITPKLYMMALIGVFVLLLVLRLDGVLKTPFSVVFIPLHLALYVILVICRKRSATWARPYLTWSTACHIVFFAFLSLDFDLSCSLDIDIRISNLAIPLYVVTIPFWMNLFSPILHAAGVL